MHGDAHYHDGGGKLNNERSALLFRLLFRKIEHMRIFRVELTFHETVFHFDTVFHGHFRVVSSGQKLQHRKKAMSNHHCASEMIVS